MTDKVGEQLSAWMDGELPTEEVPLLLKRVEEDRALRLRLERYHLIRDAMKGGLPEMFSNRMADRLDEELRGDAPAQTGAAMLAGGQRSWRKPLVGFGIAASVALFALLGIRANGPLTPGPAAVQQIAAQTPRAPVSVPIRRASSATRWEAADPEVARRLNDYLVNHSEYASSAGMRGVPPHARIVGYDRGE